MFRFNTYVSRQSSLHCIGTFTMYMGSVYTIIVPLQCTLIRLLLRLSYSITPYFQRFLLWFVHNNQTVIQYNILLCTLTWSSIFNKLFTIPYTTNSRSLHCIHKLISYVATWLLIFHAVAIILDSSCDAEVFTCRIYLIGI